MLVMQIMAAPTPKMAVSYDPEGKCLVYEKGEILGLVQLQNPEDPEEVQMLPCYLVSNKYGFFWVPELEYNFLMYVDIGQTLSMTSAWIQERIKEIEEAYAAIDETEPETVEVETKGNLSKIRRIKHIKKEEGTDDT